MPASVFTAVFNAVIDLAETVKPAGAPAILVGSLPANDGLSMQVSSGAPVGVSLNKGAAYEFTLVLNGKSRDQQAALDALSVIHAALARRKQYPRTEVWQITDISTIALPMYLDREENSQWLYGSSLRVRFYYF